MVGDVVTYLPNRDFLLEVAKGNVPGHTLVNKFGRNLDIDTGSVPETVWGGGGLYTGHPTGSPETVELSSDDSADTSAGTGMRTIRIYGLKTSTSTAYETEDVTLNGTSWVSSAETWYRVNRAVGLTYGSGGTNAGGVTIRHTTTTANIFAVVPADGGQTAICCYTIPTGSTGYLVGGFVRMVRANGSPGSANCSLRIREAGGSGFRAGMLFDVSHSASAQLGQIPGETIFQGGDDVKVRVDDVSDSNTMVNANMVIVLVED